MANKVVTGAIISFLFLLSISAIFGIIYFIPSSSQSGIIPSSCVVESQDFSFNNFNCPDDASLCEATVTLDCSTKVSEDKVVFRGSTQQALPQQIAVDTNGDGALESYTRSSGFSSGCGSPIVFLPDPYQQNYVCKFNNEIRIWKADENRAYSYASGGSISTQNSPISGESCSGAGGFIKCAGNTQAYVCSEPLRNELGQVIKEITYTGSQAGSTTESVILGAGEGIRWLNRIDYEVSEIQQSQCTKDIRGDDPDEYFQCTINNNGCGVLSNQISFCEDGLVFKESTGECGTAYNLELSSNKRVYATGERITGKIDLSDSDKVSFIQTRISLVDVLGNEKDFTTVSTNSRGEASFSLDGQTLTGDYLIIAEPEHPDGNVPVEITVTISQPINLRLAPFPDRIQYNSEPITVKAFVTDSDGNAEDASSWDFSGTKCGSRDLSRDVEIQRLGRTSQGTEYLLRAETSNTCQFTFKAIAVDDSGFRSQADAVNIEVRSAEVLIKPDLSSVQDKDAGRRTVSFTTLDPNLQLLDTINNVKITDSDGCVSGEFCITDNKVLPEVIVTGDDGSYSFTYTFKDGLSTIQITSSSSEIQSTTQEFIVNLFPTGSQDPIGGGTDNGIPLGLIFTSGILLVGVVIFIVILTRGRRRR